MAAILKSPKTPSSNLGKMKFSINNRLEKCKKTILFILEGSVFYSRLHLLLDTYKLSNRHH